MYVLCQPERASAVFNIVARALKEHAGIDVNLGKCKVWNRAAAEPPGVRALGPDVWVGGVETAEHRRGLVVLGSPLDTDAFVKARCTERLAEQKRLLELLPQVPDLQSSWLLLSYCAGPRAVHTLRTLPPTPAAGYAQGHDDALWTCLKELLALDGLLPEDEALARKRLGLPLRHGGLGLRSASRGAPAAYWASWADVLPMMARRNPALALQFVQGLSVPNLESAACLKEAEAARQLVQEAGFEAPS